jgi:hypothetical protein
MGSEASVPSLFSGQTGAYTVVGTILGNSLSHLGPRVDEQTVSNDPLAHGDPFSLIRTRQTVVWVFPRLNIIIIDQILQQQRLHTHLLVLVCMVPVVISSGQQIKLVLAYSRMLPNGQQI